MKKLKSVLDPLKLKSLVRISPNKCCFLNSLKISFSAPTTSYKLRNIMLENKKILFEYFVVIVHSGLKVLKKNQLDKSDNISRETNSPDRISQLC